ncbi:MAG: helix-hairpin-helix domain-containing protein [Bacteroidales bacterium]|nr:helix-hairpin-helix domain-containing protein [Bacteroidales bacterium]
MSIPLPTRGQWRGYTVLCIVLVVALLVLIFWPIKERNPKNSDYSRLQVLVDEYGEGIRTADSMRRDSMRQMRYHSYTDKNGKDYRRYVNGKTYQPFEHKREYNRTVIDINSADTAMLRSLYGIGPVLSQRIVKYRDLLGGFVRKEQLLEVYGLTNECYSGISERITVNAANKKIKINEATVQELKKHPYIDYYQAKAIVDYRNSGHHIENMQDLLLINLIDETTVTKLQGYIQFN